MWAIIAIIVGSFIKMVVIPNWSRKIALRKAARMLKKRAEEQTDPEEARKLNELANGLKAVSKQSTWKEDE